MKPSTTAFLSLVFSLALSSSAWGQAGEPSSFENDWRYRNALLSQLESLDYEIENDRSSLWEIEEDLRRAGEQLDDAVDAGWEAIDTADSAQARLNEALDLHRKLVTGLKQRVEEDPETVAARDGLVQAIDALSVQRRRVLDPLRATPAHSEVSRSLESLRAQLKAISPDNAELKPKRDALMLEVQAGTNERTRIENEALRADEGYRAANERSRQSRIELHKTRKRVEQRLASSGDRKAAAEAKEAAKLAAEELDKESRAAQDVAYEAQDEYDRLRQVRRELLQRIRDNEYLYQQTRAALAGPVRFRSRVIIERGAEGVR